MNYIPFKFKITSIFLVPSIVLVYLLFIFVTNKYAQLQQSSIIKFSTEITTTLSKLVHNIQVERGLSSGYTQQSHSQSATKKLFVQYLKTNKTYEHLKYYIELQSDTKQRFYALVSYKVQPIINKLLVSLNRLKEVRAKILNHEMDFDAKIKYYSDIDTNVITVMKIINNIIYKQDNSAIIEILQYQKEKAGLERAYVYSQLLCKNKDPLVKKKIEKLQESQVSYEKDFFIIASLDTTLLYNQEIDTKIKKTLERFRKKFKEGSLSVENANEWFSISTRYIEKIDNVLFKIFQSYTSEANRQHDSAQVDLVLALGLGILSYIALLLMFFLLMKLIKKEEYLMKDLKFAAYAFDSHEAIVITDAEGTILKVNTSFTDITGYPFEEVVGANPRLLKSDMHPDEFYEDMYEKLESIGKWSGEIYNKRKNGDVYPELLSITAIKNDENIITNYIAQFLDISELKEAQQKAIYQANHDFLTGIMNRKAITQRLEEEFSRALRHNFLEAFLFIDLDDFKAINDNYGHKIGDMMLIEFSARLQSILRKEDVLARLSGDEFAVIILNTNNSLEELISCTHRVCDKIFKVISEEFILDENVLSMGASIGVSVFPQEQENSDVIVAQADEAMYQAKTSGKNKVFFYK